MSLYKVVPMEFRFPAGVSKVVSIEGQVSKTGQKRILVEGDGGERQVFYVVAYHVGPDTDNKRPEGRVHVELSEHNNGTAFWPESEWLRDNGGKPPKIEEKEAGHFDPNADPTTSPCFTASVEYLARVIREGKLPSEGDKDCPKPCPPCALFQLIFPEVLGDAIKKRLAN